MLDHLVTYNIKKNNNQHNDAIENEPNFDNKFSLYSGTKPPTSSCCKTQGSKKIEWNNGSYINTHVG